MNRTSFNKRVTAKARVLKRWPDATIDYWFRDYYIEAWPRGYYRMLGQGNSPRLAWLDASKRLR